ncbi:hypothetical protein DSO57_1001849 [Entomophthora muscae]|uniref:Uncharacterized protein n=1 Tax=Entomophthora muscae TaxID=34485 RepID=A0ACC2SY58_9FUNG|nr:hypothetical protein DSO57_1001849 [Entomophthora muscae]
MSIRVKGSIIRKEPLIASIAQETVALPYAEQLTLPTTEVTHDSDSAKKMAQILKSVNVSASLDALKRFSPTLFTALEELLSKYKDIDIYQNELYLIDMMVRKVKVQAIIDSGAPGNIISLKLFKKIKLAPDLDYQEIIRTESPLTTKAMGTYLSLLLLYGKLIVTAPAIVLDNNSYDIIIGTGFMTRYRTITNHGDDTFKILGRTIPMYYNGAKVVDLLKKLHFINREYADSDIAVVYTLQTESSECFHCQLRSMLCLAPGDNIQEDTTGNLYNKRFEVLNLPWVILQGKIKGTYLYFLEYKMRNSFWQKGKEKLEEYCKSQHKCG